MIHSRSPRFRLSLGLLVGLLPILAIFPHLVSIETVYWMLLEDGFLESLAVWLWALAALAALTRSFPPRALMLAYVVVFAALAQRESGYTPALLQGGKRVLKLSYYLGAETPLGQRIAVGAILLGIIAALVFSAWGTWRNLRRPRELDREELGVLMLGAQILVASQLFEALQDRLEPLGAAAFAVARSCWSLEEGLEALAPLVIALALARRRNG